MFDKDRAFQIIKPLDGYQNAAILRQIVTFASRVKFAGESTKDFEKYCRITSYIVIESARNLLDLFGLTLRENADWLIEVCKDQADFLDFERDKARNEQNRA